MHRSLLLPGFVLAAISIFPGTVRAEQKVFLTSEAFLGNLGGLSGADATCQRLADSAGLGGTWIAWLSTSAVNARDRLKGDGPFVLVDGTTVATNRADLLDGNLDHAIDLTELGTTPAKYIVWTGTTTAGTVATAPNTGTCSNWKSNSGYPNLGTLGVGLVTNSQWTYYATTTCNFPQPLYCFEQAPTVVAIPALPRSGLFLLAVALLALGLYWLRR